MELSQDFLLQELLTTKRGNYFSTYPSGVVTNEFYTNCWSCDFIHDEPLVSATATDYDTALSMPQMEPFFDVPFNQVYSTLDATSFPAVITSVADQSSLLYEINNHGNIAPLQAQDQNETLADKQFICLANGVQHMEEDKYATGRKIEMPTSPAGKQEPDKSPVTGGQRRHGVKKVGGLPSKNLMAERRRRKRLNDRLSMLRSIVPKISKTDRTSILADTVCHMKELLEKVGELEEEMEDEQIEIEIMKNLKNLRSNEVQTKSSPKFDVKMSEKNTSVSICCPSMPDLLLSTVSTLEELGLEIQQCVVSCFNDFSMQAACSQVSKELTAEEIKRALFRNAGYEGRYLKETTQK